MSAVTIPKGPLGHTFPIAVTSDPPSLSRPCTQPLFAPSQQPHLYVQGGSRCVAVHVWLFFSLESVLVLVIFFP